jgi:16S rRNA G966 N2-methylase RsmD
MGATFSIHTTTTAEFLALQSEGAPELSGTYSTGAVVLAAVGIVPDEPFAVIPAGDVAAAAATLHLADARDWVAGWSGAPFDLVLLDPPYALAEEVLATLLTDLVPVLSDGATVVVERAAAAPGPRWPAALRAVSERRYGSTRLHRAERVAGEGDAGEGEG